MPDEPEQPMLGLHLEPTIAIHHGEAFVVQCNACGTLIAVSSSHTSTHRPRDLGPCPSCGSDNGWSKQSIPVGPFYSEWGHMIAGSALALLKAPTSEWRERIGDLRDTYRRAIRSTRETAPWYERLEEELQEAY